MKPHSIRLKMFFLIIPFPVTECMLYSNIYSSYLFVLLAVGSRFFLVLFT
jgi:hypothetical protein